jgi:hypothetical protein
MDAQSATEQLFLKAFRNSPGASAELQQILACNTEAAAAILASTLQPMEAFGEIKGDYLVLQTPIIQTQVASTTKQAPKTSQPRTRGQPRPDARSAADAKPLLSPQKPGGSEVRPALSSGGHLAGFAGSESANAALTHPEHSSESTQVSGVSYMTLTDLQTCRNSPKLASANTHLYKHSRNVL